MGRKLRIRYAKKPKAAPAPDRVRVDLAGPYDLERFSYELQKLIACLQERGVQGTLNASLYLTPTNDRGEALSLKDEQGQPITTL
jgi:hypothetical protein